MDKNVDKALGWSRQEALMTKRAFYPNDEIEKYLESLPKRQISSRLNDLILKGLTLEHQMQVERDYNEYAEKLSQLPQRKKNKQGISATMLMSAKAFEAEDEVEDFI